MADTISEGDRVNVYFENVEALFDYEVLYTPQATGDSWRLKHRNGMIVYVQLFSKIEKIEEFMP